jgi:hypothetical protein
MIKDDVSALIRVLKQEDECPSAYLSILRNKKPLHQWGPSYYFEIDGEKDKWLFQPFGSVLVNTTYVNMLRLNTLNQMCKADSYGIGPTVYEAYVCGDLCFAIIQSWSVRSKKKLDCEPRIGKAVPSGEKCSVISTKQMEHLLNVCMKHGFSVINNIGFVGAKDKPIFTVYEHSVSMISTSSEDDRRMFNHLIIERFVFSGKAFRLVNNKGAIASNFFQEYCAKHNIGIILEDLASSFGYNELKHLIDTVTITPLSATALINLEIHIYRKYPRFMEIHQQTFADLKPYISGGLIPDLGEWTDTYNELKKKLFNFWEQPVDVASELQLEDNENNTNNLNPIVKLMKENLPAEEYERMVSTPIETKPSDNQIDNSKLTFRNGHQPMRHVDQPRTYFVHDNGERPFGVFINVHETNFNRKLLRVDVHGLLNYENYTSQPIHQIYADEFFIGRDPSEKEFNFFSDGNTVLIRSHDRYYTFIGEEMFRFEPFKPIVLYISKLGNSDVPYPWAVDTAGRIYLMMASGESVMSFRMPGVQMSKDFDVTIEPYLMYYDNLFTWKNRVTEDDTAWKKRRTTEADPALKGATREQDVDEYTRRTRYGQVCVCGNVRLTLDAYLFYVDTVQPMKIPKTVIYPRGYYDREDYKTAMQRFNRWKPLVLQGVGEK